MAPKDKKDKVEAPAKKEAKRKTKAKAKEEAATAKVTKKSVKGKCPRAFICPCLLIFPFLLYKSH